MKFVLAAVNAKYIHSNPAVYSLAAYAQKKNPLLKEHMAIREYTINHQMEDILADIYEQKMDVIGFSCYIWNIDYIEKIITDLHLLLPKVSIWLGGPEVSYRADEVLMKYPFVKGVMVGEGEETFYELMTQYEQIWRENKDTENSNRVIGNARMENVPGLCIWDETESKPIYTRARELTNLTDLPFLYDNMEPFTNRIIYYESSRGCPFRCSYCLSSIDKTVRLRDLEVVKSELQYFLDQKLNQVKFVDRTFNCNKKHAYEIWKYIKEHDNGITNFHFEVAADILDEEELTLLNQFRPGAVQLEIGVQSTNPETITEIDRRMDVQKLSQIVGRIREGNNIHIHLDLIAGLPYEDMESFKKSFNDVYAMKPEQLQLGFLKVLRGSKMYEKRESYGLVYSQRPPYEVLYTNWISFEEIRKLKQVEEMVEIYYNSNQFVTTLSAFVKRYPNAFAFFEALGQFFEKNGYFIQTPARSYRYQVLLDFLTEDLALSLEEIEYAKQCLMFDLYLRENLKTRPAFAPDQESYKQRMRDFYQSEAKQFMYLPAFYQDKDARTLAKMTHLETFTYDLQSGERLSEPQMCLFDYQTRNPLTYDAMYYFV